MTREETQTLLMAIVTYYPNYKVPATDAEMKVWLDVWQDMFSDVPYEKVMKALKAFVKSNPTGFGPFIGQLNDMVCRIDELTEDDSANEMEAWDMVAKALRRSSWHSEEEFNKLPPLVKKAVGSSQMLHNWATDDNYSESVVMSQFLRTYRAEVERSRQLRRMPVEIQRQVEQKQQERLKIEYTKDE